MIIRIIGRVCLAIALLLVWAPTAVDAKPKDKAKARIDKRKEHRKDARERRHDRREKARKHRRVKCHRVVVARRTVVYSLLGGASPPELRVRAKVVVEARKDLAKARLKARRARIIGLRKYLKQGKKPILRATLKAELTIHSRRMARLARIREVAEEKNDTVTLVTVDKLLVREQNRHQGWMEYQTGQATDEEEEEATDDAADAGADDSEEEKEDE